MKEQSLDSGIHTQSLLGRFCHGFWLADCGRLYPNTFGVFGPGIAADLGLEAVLDMLFVGGRQTIA